MPVFMQLRLWLAQSSVRERGFAGAAVAIAVLLLVLASLPLTDDDGDAGLLSNAPLQTGAVGAESAEPRESPESVPTEPAAGGASSAAMTGGSTDSGEGDGGGAPAASATPPAPGGQASEGGAGCSDAGASETGVSESEVVIAASIVNLAGPVGNTAFSIRPDMEEVVDAVVEHINSGGGVACGRKLVVRKYAVNPIDANDQQAKCLQMVQDKVFSVVDMAGYARPVGRTCFVQNKLPHQISTSSTDVDLKKGYPYLYGENASSEKQVRDGILGLHELGFFGGSEFKKLGLLVDSCDPTVEAEIEASLQKIGIGSNKVSKYKMNCSLVAPPNEVLQGVVQHKSAGVSHVFLATALSNSTRYTSLAAQQGFRPKYGMSDYGTLTSAAATWDRSAAGALAVTSTRRGELNSGVRNPRLEECHAIITAKGLRGIESEKDDGAALNICDALFFWKKAIDRAGANPTRLSLIESGLATIGEHQSGGGSDGLWNRRGKVVGGDYHRTLRLDGGCLCMKVVASEFEPGF